jgi:hypothetical protein
MPGDEAVGTGDEDEVSLCQTASAARVP